MIGTVEKMAARGHYMTLFLYFTNGNRSGPSLLQNKYMPVIKDDHITNTQQWVISPLLQINIIV